MTVRWGIIGCGKVTEVKSGPAFNKVDGSSLVAVMRRDLAKAEDYARRHNVPKWYDDADALINDSDLDAVYIATPPDTHMKYAIKAIRAGKPVYIEKPMALNYNECEAILRESEKYKIPVYVAYYRRGLPSFNKVKELLDSGAIGKPLAVQLQLFKADRSDPAAEVPWRYKPEISGGGIFVDLGSHQIDFLDYIFGPVDVVDSVVLNQSGKYIVEDFVMANLILGDNLPCSATWCFSASGISDRDIVEITGEKGSIIFSSFDYSIPVSCKNKEGVRNYYFEKPEHVQLPLITLVVNDIRGKGISPSRGITAARSNRVMDIILAEYYKKDF